MRDKEPLSREKALLRMADLCAAGERCSFEISKKLRLKGMSESDIAAVVDELVRRGFVDDTRFARAFARDKVRFSSWGRLKIRAALAAKHIPARLIADALGAIEPDDYREALLRSARARARSLDLSQRDDLQKLYRHLASRGFEPAIVSRLVAKLSRSSGHPDKTEKG